jgi:hypothetical protein
MPDIRIFTSPDFTLPASQILPAPDHNSAEVERPQISRGFPRPLENLESKCTAQPQSRNLASAI